jgi:flavin reductase (DIM6/NTAB) family NADH-FMN oxidoreductase RutF
LPERPSPEAEHERSDAGEALFSHTWTAEGTMNEIAALCRQITLGVYVVGVAHDGRRDAFTAAWVMQASFEPLLVAVSVNPQNASYPLLRAGGGFVVNVLRRGQLDVARHFGTRPGRDQDKLAGIGWRPGRSGAPILTDVLAYLDCELTKSMPIGDHELVVGRVMDGQIFARDAEPMVYAETGDMAGNGALYPVRF